LYTLFELKDKTNPCDKVRIYTNGQKWYGWGIKLESGWGSLVLFCSGLAQAAG
jgi:hypothetical protein